MASNLYIQRRMVGFGAFVFLVIAWVGESVFAASIIDRLARAPLLIAPAISSDGHYLSALIRQKDSSSRVAVWRAPDGYEQRELLPYTRLNINWMAWVGGGRLLISTNENGLVLYDAHLKRLRPLIEGRGPRPNELPPVLLSHLPDDPTSILMQWEDPGVAGFPAVYKVNAITGESEKVISAWKPVIRWYASPEGEVRLGEGFKGRQQLLYTGRPDGSWKQISKRDYFKGPAHSVLAVEAGSATALVLSAHASNTRDLWRMDIATGEMRNRLASHKYYDISSALIDPVTDLAVGALYVAEGMQQLVWRADKRNELASVAERIGVNSVFLLASSRDGRRSLYRHNRNDQPSSYYLWDREADTIQALPEDDDLDTFPKLRTEGVSIPVPKIKQRMHALLSYPETGLTKKTVVLLHGGPVRRVRDRFVPYVSLLIAQGYNVLQPNFRGSSGYGERWRKAGYAEWGRMMQVDVRAAAEWLVDESISAPRDMCVTGGSYGGYAALMSSFKDDDLFACAISLNGVTSLPHLISYLSQNRFHDLTVPRILGRLSDRALRKRSPVFRASLIDIPVLLLHATVDRNVPFEHGAMMAAALAKYEKDYEFIVLKDSEHQLRKEADRKTYLTNTVDFLNRHLKPA
ncbi:MAG: alpha/beta hydrolase family protein, partial [Kordiimonas sp.]